MVIRRHVALAVTLLAAAQPSAAQVPTDAAIAAASHVARPQFLALPDFLTPGRPRVWPAEPMLSGLAWYGDDLILLPQQRPVDGERSVHRGKLYAISRHALERAVDEPSDAPLPVDTWELVAPGVDALDGYEGFEAIAFAGDTVFMTVESDTRRGPRAWLLRGRVDATQRTIRMEPADVVITGRSGVNNLTEEALVVHDGEVISIHEANGPAVNPDPVVHAFPVARAPGRPPTGREMPMAPVEYRITDATTADDEGRFWVSNYFFPGDRALRAADALLGGPPSDTGPARVEWVERLVELRVTDEGVVPTGRPPIYVEPGEQSRNWEGIAWLGSRGFLLVVDKYPSTLLAFVPLPVR